MANILVVDDNFVARKNLKEALIKAGHLVIGEAGNGNIAIKQFERLQPDLVTMDISMPELNGIDATEAIINISPNARIVMVSARSQKEMVLKALEVGAKHFIVKPFDPRTVSNIISDVLIKDGFVEPEVETSQDSELTKPINVNIEFALEKRGNTLVVLPSQGTEKYLSEIIDSIITTKPLLVAINILSLEKISHQLFEDLAKTVDKIQNANGKIEIYTYPKLFSEFIDKPKYKAVIDVLNKFL